MASWKPGWAGGRTSAAAGVGGVEPANPSNGSTDTTGAETAPPRRRAAILAAVAVGLVVVLVVLVSVTTRTGEPGPTTAASSTAPPIESSTAPPTTPPPPPGDVLLADDFSGPSLDPAKWRTPARYPDNMFQRDGHLVRSVRPGKEVDYGKLESQPLSQSFTHVTFTATVLPSEHAGDGGGSFVVNGGGSQPQVVMMGPSAEGGVFIDPLTCDKPSCSLAVYEDFTQPDYKAPPIALGEAVPVEIVRKDGHLVFYAKGVELGRTKADPGTLDEFWFAVSSGGSDSWDVQIDDLVVR